jgi:large subunit ribosomal protein L19
MATGIGTQFLPKDMQVRKDLDLRAGDTVRVHQKIQEKDKVRIQIFEGIVLARKHGTEAGGTFTVRKVTSGVGVERVFPLYSPMIDKIEVIRRATTRRAKLYFIRTKVARDIRKKLRNFVDFFASSASLVIPTEEMAEEVPKVIAEKIEDVVTSETPAIEETKSE